MRHVVVVLAVSLLAACGSRPTVEATNRFASALANLNAVTSASLATVGSYEVAVPRQRDALLYATARGEREISRTAGALRQQPVSVAAAAQSLLAPSLEALTGYAERLAFLSGDDALRPLNSATDKLVSEIAKGAADVQAALGGAALPANDVATGVAAGQAIARFLADRALTRALVPQVRRMDGTVQAFAGFLKQIIGTPTTAGVRRALATVRPEDTAQWVTLLAAAAADRSVDTLGRRRLFLEAVDALERRPTDTLLAAVVTAVDRMATAHAALVEPEAQTTREKIEDFVAAVRSLAETYQTLRAQ